MLNSITSKLKLLLLITISSFLFSCGGGGGSTTTTTQSGFLSAAPINGATCDIFKVVSGAKSGLSLQTASSIFGKVEFKDINYTGTALIECKSGTYNDEATDTTKTQPPLRLVVNFNPNNGFAVTPLSEIAFQMDTNLDNVLGTHNATVAKSFGLEGIDITKTLPTDIDNKSITDDNSGKFASVLAMLSQLDSTSGATLSATITSFKDDLADGKLSNANINKLSDTTTNLKTTTKNIKTKLHTTVLDNLKTSLNANLGATGLLNDTGLTWGGNYSSGNNATCTGETISAQDCSHGRDAGLSQANSTFTFVAGAGTTKTAKIGAGMAGFDFTKLGSTGNVLAIQTATWTTGGTGLESAGTKWSCVRDNHTGMIWEVKTDNGVADSDTTDATHTNIHHKDNTYRWGGKTAIGKTHASTQGTYYDDWTGLVDGTNAENLCGFNDWRVPTREELRSIVNYGTTNPAIDTNYFPNTISGLFWPSSPKADGSSNAWALFFGFNYGNGDDRSHSYWVRLVRLGE